jgi:hypothetical protein
MHDTSTTDHGARRRNCERVLRDATHFIEKQEAKLDFYVPEAKLALGGEQWVPKKIYFSQQPQQSF